ncbi:nuclear transport factor 2 family protein [Sphingomonas gilva]|nr:nuclear transport factor 2 family protein [Sphingomonas gilva]
MAMLVAVAMLSACAGEPVARADVSVETLREVGDRFDQAQIAKDGAVLQTLVADDLIFIEGDGTRSGKKAFIDGWTDPALSFEPIAIEDRVFVPLGPDAGIVGGEVVLRGRANGAPFASHIRFADTFRLKNGTWQATHIQVTRVPANK